jgi:hypothetical protein
VSGERLGIGLTPYTGGIHAARLDTTLDGGFALALCSSRLWVSVEHNLDGVPVEAGLESRYAGHVTVAERPDCLRCVRSLTRLAQLATIGQAVAMEPADKRRENLTPGGKSLSGDGEHSPVLQVRVSVELRDRIRAAAADAGMSPSRYARNVLEGNVP